MIKPSAIEIVAGAATLEPPRPDLSIYPLTRGEAGVARFGMLNRYSYYFNRAKDRTELDGLKAVCWFLTEKIDKYRTQAQRVAQALAPTIEQDRAYQAVAMSEVLYAVRAKSKGWPNKSQEADVLREQTDKLAELNSEEFEQARVNLARIAIGNGHYWVGKLQQHQDFYVVEKLKAAYASSHLNEYIAELTEAGV